MSVVLGAGCAAEETGQQSNTVNGPFGGDAAFYPEATPGLVPVGNDGGWAYPEGGSTGGPDGIGGGTGAGLPADVCGVLQKNGCLSCHNTPLAGGAQMPLTMRDHFAINAKDGSPLAQKVLARVTSADAPMPPKSTGRNLMVAADVDILKNWINGGMTGVPGGAACTEPKTNINDIGTDVVPDWATRGWPTDPKECDYILTVGAHGRTDTPYAKDTTGFVVPNNTDTHYHCFYEQVPWGPGEQVQAIAMRTKIETPQDKALVHHYVVSGQEGFNFAVAGAKPDRPGDHKPCQNPNGATMGIWAPGGIDPLTYPEDVGVRLPPSGSYIELQIHYNGANKYVGSRESRAAYEICVTKKLRPQTAGVFWLGYENAFAETLLTGAERTGSLDNKGGGTAMGACSAKTKGRILSVMPHMHEQGIHGKFEVVRKDGTTQTIMDDGFDFLDQKSYFRQSLWVEQGDRIRTTCKFKKSPVYFGFGSQDEMCFFYTLAYPLEAFKAGPTEKGFVGGDLACAGGVGWL